VYLSIGRGSMGDVAGQKFRASRASTLVKGGGVVHIERKLLEISIIEVHEKIGLVTWQWLGIVE